MGVGAIWVHARTYAFVDGAFVDGNKRAGLVAAHVFFWLNGYTVIAATLAPWRAPES